MNDLDAVYGNDTPTMLGPTGAARKRRVLKPGMNTADGTPWNGSAVKAGLLKRKQQLEAKIAELQAELEKVIAMIPPDESASEEEAEVKPKKKVKKEQPDDGPADS